MSASDTIAAIATPPGAGGIGIVRISGRCALRAAQSVFRASGPDAAKALRTHRVYHGHVRDPVTGEDLDEALLLVFRAPRSYTGEDTAELSCHGGPAVLRRVLGAALNSGCRPALPGEFTQRAFLNGKLDLAQAEAVCDLVRAKTEAQRRLALEQREGRLSKEVRAVRDDLIGLLAAVEVTIDFSDDVGDLDYGEASARIASLLERLGHLKASASRGRLLREGARLVLCGRPNAGKSSLLNALLGEERAIVTSEPGTTRDTIEETAEIGGFPVVAVDTAGLREARNEAERMGVERARKAIERADLILHVVDLSDRSDLSGLSDRGEARLVVLSKCDLLAERGSLEVARDSLRSAGFERWHEISALTGAGIGALEEAISEALLSGVASEAAIGANARHVDAIGRAIESLREGAASAGDLRPPDFLSIDLRAAADALGEITGETASAEVIDRIFRDFCVGK